MIIHKHYKGNYYLKLHDATLEVDLTPVTVYKNYENRIWVRPTAEFDAKFKPTSIVPFELRILRHLNGAPDPDLEWGAAMSAAIEGLKGLGLVDHTNSINDAGKQVVQLLGGI